MTEEDNIMNEKEKADCLLELNKSRLDHFMQTRTIEFQVNIAIWTLIVIGGAYLSERIHLASVLGYVLFILLAFLIIGVHYIWMILIHYSESIDHGYMNDYRREIDKLTEISIKEPQQSKEYELYLKKLEESFKYKRGRHWVYLETAMTAVLLFVVLILLSISNSNQKSNSIKDPILTISNMAVYSNRQN